MVELPISVPTQAQEEAPQRAILCLHGQCSASSDTAADLHVHTEVTPYALVICM